jgi:RNA polymerase sigma-70 factor (ECF subfamily)
VQLFGEWRVSLRDRQYDRFGHDDRGDAPPPGHVMAEPTPTTAELFERAVRLHAPRLIVVARAVVGRHGSAEDVVQQALMNLYRHRERYDWREPVGLLRRTVVNEALRLLRQLRPASVAEEPVDAPAAPRTPDGQMIQSETVEQVRRAIAKLPEHFRAALVLCEYEGMDYAQIADVLGASVPQVKTWLHRGRRQLAAMLQPLHDADVKDAAAGRRTVG